MLRSAAFATSVVASMPTVFPLHQTRLGQSLQHPGEDRLVCLEIDQAPRAENRRMIGRRLRRRQSEKLAQGKRIDRPPRDRALGVQPFEVADQQHPKVAPRRQPWPSHVRIELLAEPFNEPVEVIWSRVERMSGTLRQVLIFPQELPLLISAAGLELISRFGELSRAPFGPGSRVQVCLCRRRA